MRLAIILACSATLVAQVPVVKTAAEERRAEIREEVGAIAAPGMVTITAMKSIATPNPIGIVANLFTGFLSMEIQKRVASSEWAMTMTQKYAAPAIAQYLAKRDKTEWIITNSKVDQFTILTLKREGMTPEIAESVIKEEPLVKWRKCGWDRIIFTDGTNAWGYDTAR